MRDKELPNTRPEKYKWMFHAEQNALANSPVRPVGATAYVTGEPCNNCLFSLWQHGVTRVVFTAGHGSFDTSVYDREQREKFLHDTGMQLVMADCGSLKVPEMVRVNETNLLRDFAVRAMEWGKRLFAFAAPAKSVAPPPS
jgi:deoxycytidylate deaminase